MKASEFVSILEEIVPSEEALRNAGKSELVITDLVKGYSFTKRSIPLKLTDCIKNELTKLMSNYDMSNFEVGCISFLDIPTMDQYGLNFAKDESDPFYVSKDGIIEIR